MVQFQFNASQVAPNTALEAIPSGNYPVLITASGKKPTKDGQGNYLEFEMTVQGGEFNGRKVYDRLNVENKSDVAVQIAYATLSAICHVTGKLQMTQTEQLHGVPFIAVVLKKPYNDGFSNEVKGYKDMQGNDPGKAPGGGGQGGNSGGPAWGNNQNGGGQQGNQGGQGGGQGGNWQGNNGNQNNQSGGQQGGGNGWGPNGGGQQDGNQGWQGNGQQNGNGNQGQGNQGSGQGGQGYGNGNGGGNNGGGQGGQLNSEEPPPWAQG